MWAIQSNLFSQWQEEHIISVLDDNSIPWVNVMPDKDKIVFLDALPLGKNIIPYGSTKLVRLARQCGWNGVFFDDHNFNVETWNLNRKDMLNSDAIITTVSEASTLFEKFDYRSIWFIRPTEDFKAFGGTVTTAEQIRIWKSSPDTKNFSFPDTTRVAISKWKEINSESRYFIVGGKVIDGSTYKINNQRQTIHETDINKLQEIQRLADLWLPHETCVMDVADTPNGLKIVEFNCINCSGFYDHNINLIIKKVNSYFGN